MRRKNETYTSFHDHNVISKFETTAQPESNQRWRMAQQLFKNGDIDHRHISQFKTTLVGINVENAYILIAV